MITYITNCRCWITKNNNGGTIVIINQWPNIWTRVWKRPFCDDIFPWMSVTLMKMSKIFYHNRSLYYRYFENKYSYIVIGICYFTYINENCVNVIGAVISLEWCDIWAKVVSWKISKLLNHHIRNNFSQLNHMFTYILWVRRLTYVVRWARFDFYLYYLPYVQQHNHQWWNEVFDCKSTTNIDLFIH